MKMRKNLFGGFRKKDVMNYITEESTRYESEIAALKHENDLVNEKLNSCGAECEKLRKSLEERESELLSRINELEETVQTNMTEYNKERLCANAHITELQLKRKQLLKELDENLLSAELKRVTAERDALQVKLQRAIVERDYARKGE